MFIGNTNNFAHQHGAAKQEEPFAGDIFFIYFA